MHRGQPDNIPNKELVYCNRCKGDTRHECCWKDKREDVEHLGKEYGGGQFVETTVYICWRCLGCESVSLEERYTNDGMSDMDGDGMLWGSSFHPDRERQKIPRKHFKNLPERLARIYNESLVAFNAGTPLLAAIGLRGLIEGVCLDKGIKGGNLEKKIDGLAAVLPQNIVDHLHSLRFMGNTATHELTPPTSDELKLAIELCEDLLNFLYELNYKATRLGALTSRLRPVKRSKKNAPEPQK